MNSKDLPEELHRLCETHKNNPLCACVDTDAYECYRRRYQHSEFYDDTEKCTCPCHDKEDDEDEESPTRVCIHKAEYPKGRHYGQCFCLDCMLATCINYDFSNGG